MSPMIKPLRTGILTLRNSFCFQVVTKKTPLPPGLVSINSCGFGGVNGNIVMERYAIDTIINYQKPKHRLVCFSGRTSEAVEYGLDRIKEKEDDGDFLGLLDKIHEINIPGHIYRGYILIQDVS